MVDLTDRSIPGAFLYMVVWLAIVLPSMTYFGAEHRLQIILDLTCVVMGAALFRLLLLMYLQKHLHRIPPERGELLITLSVIVSSLAWGLSVAYLFSLNRFQ